MKYFIFEMRTKRNMSLRTLAERSGVAKSHIQKIEAGEANPSLEVMCRLAQALGCEITELFRYK